MSTGRLAELFRLRAKHTAALAQIDREIADEMEGKAKRTSPAPPPENRKPILRTQRVVVPIVPFETTDTDVAFARRHLKRRGIRVNDRQH